MKKILRIPEGMTVKRQTLEAARYSGFLISKKSVFSNHREYLVINHGSCSNISFCGDIKKAYLLNQPSEISLSIDKLQTHKRLIEKLNDVDEYVPKWSNHQDIFSAINAIGGLPVVVKPRHGMKSRGIRFVDNENQIRDLKYNSIEDIVQKRIKTNEEFRFIFIGNKLVNISKKIIENNMPSWNSLGNHRFEPDSLIMKKVIKIRNAFPTLPSIAIDFMRENREGRSGRFWFLEINTAYGLGEYTAIKMADEIDRLIESGEIEQYRVC